MAVLHVVNPAQLAREARAGVDICKSATYLGSFAEGVDNPLRCRRTVPPRIDIRALLLIALDEKPPPGLPDKVMARVAMLTTMVEFARMLGAAPIDWITQRSDPNDNGNHE